MSYEGEMHKKLCMPRRQEVEIALLKTLFKHNGTIKEFASGEDIVDELAELFSLNEEQRVAVLERIYKKENRIVRTPLWHRLLYRAADSLAKEKLVSRPTSTEKITDKKEWMLTEDGYEKAMRILNIPIYQKDLLPVKSFEVQKFVNKLKATSSPENYNPIESSSKRKNYTKQLCIRSRGFRQAIIESYDFKCSVCGLKIMSPDNRIWEVEAAHIVPRSYYGRDDIWNGIALCSLHHWAFDVGWFSLTNDFRVVVSSRYSNQGFDIGKIGNLNFLKNPVIENKPISLPEIVSFFPHLNSLKWHRENIFYK